MTTATTAETAVPARAPVAGDAPAVAIGADAFVVDAVVDTTVAAQPAGDLGTAPAASAAATPATWSRPAAQAAQVGVASTPDAAAGTSASGTGSIGGALLALALVIGLIVLLGWLAKRLPGVGGATHPALRVLGSLSLGPRERVVVIAVGDTQLLVGTGAAGTRVLHTLETPLPVPAEKPAPAFAQVLAQHFGKKTP